MSNEKKGGKAARTARARPYNPGRGGRFYVKDGKPFDPEAAPKAQPKPTSSSKGSAKSTTEKE